MKRFLFDSGIASDYMNRRGGVFERAKAEVARGNKIGIGTPVLGELVCGVELSTTRERNRYLLRRHLANWVLWSFDDKAAEDFGRLRAELRRLGRLMQVPDMQIAAIAKTLPNCTVVSSDSDLLAVPGLSVENWATG
jgi:tRNA(fMet)-specific endonuclease VapC